MHVAARQPAGCVECRQQPVTQVARQAQQQPIIAWGQARVISQQHVAAEQPAQHADGGLKHVHLWHAMQQMLGQQ